MIIGDRVFAEIDGVLVEVDMESPPPDQDELDRRAIAAEDTLDDDSDVDDLAAKVRRRSRLGPLRDRIVAHLRREQIDDEWQSWPDVVIAVDRDHRRLAELSSINGRIRQAALALSREGLAEVRLGDHTVFEAVRLLPAGYTD